MNMPKYLIEAVYAGGDGARGLLQDGGSVRKKAVDELVKSVGGKVEAFYYAFGDTDVYVIVDVPDNISAAAVGLTVNSTGLVNVKTRVLLTVEEIDQAVKKSPNYDRPGPG
jgi:uncharacterized protein with GYD domain